MPVYLTTIPGAVPGHDPSLAQSDDSSSVAFVAILLLIVTLVMIVAGVVRSASDGIGNALNDIFATGKTPTPVKPLPIVPMPSEPDDMFRILPNDEENCTEDSFVVLSDDISTVGNSKCFTCGRPIDEGDHQHWLM